MNINKNIKVSEWILFCIVIFMLFATMATDVNSIISCGSDATCNTLACVLGDDTGYRFSALDFAGTTGFDDLTDDTGSFTNGISINVTDLNVSGNIHFYGLTNCDTIDTDANGLLSCGTDASGGAANYSSLGGWTNTNNTNANVIFSTNTSWITYATLGGFSSANQTTYANLGGWSSLNNTVDNVIRSTNSTWITYANLGGFNKANETTYVNHGGFSTANLTGYAKYEFGANNFNGSGNITTTGYLSGQPLDGMLGSGIIWVNNTNEFAEINFSCTGLNCVYNAFKVRLINTSNHISYCDVPAGTIAVTNNQHNVLYIDKTCTVREVSIQTYITTPISPGGIADFGNVIAEGGNTYNSNGIGLENKRIIKLRKLLLLSTGQHLSVISGFVKQQNTFPQLNITTGQYIYLMDTVTSSHANSVTNKIEFLYHTSATAWEGVDQPQLNITMCDNGTGLQACTVGTGSNTKYRRHFIYMVGYNETDGDKTQLHETAPLLNKFYSSTSACLDILNNPIVFNLPSFYQYGAVPLYFYCARADDIAWVDTNWYDLRTVNSASVSGGGSTVDTSVFLLSDGSRTVTVNSSLYNQFINSLNTSWARQQFSGSPNITIDSNGMISINMSISSSGVTYDSLGGWNSVNDSVTLTNGSDAWFNLLFSNDWSNVSVSYAQIYDFNPDDYYLKINVPNCNAGQKATADGETFTCAADLYNTTENMQDSVLPAIDGGVGITATYNDGSNNESISFDCSEVMDTADDFNCGDGQEVTLKNRASYILVSNGSWVRAQFSGSSNISFDSSTGQFWINTSISGSQLTYAQLGGFSSANQTTYANLGGWSSWNNTLDNVIRSTNSTWITYSTLGGFSSANETTYVNHGGYALSNWSTAYNTNGWQSVNNTNDNVIRSTNASWILNHGQWSAVNNTVDNIIRNTNTTWISTNEKTYATHGGWQLSNFSTAYTANGWQQANFSAAYSANGFDLENLTKINPIATPINITINNITSSNGASFELFYNSTCSRLIIGSTIQYWCK